MVRTIEASARQAGRLLASLALALALTGVTASGAVGNVLDDKYTLPAVFATTWHALTGGVEATYFDGRLLSEPWEDRPVKQWSTAGGNTARAVISRDLFAASAAGGQDGGARAHAYLGFVVEDPQNRSVVKVIADSKGAGSAGPPSDPSLQNGSYFRLAIYPANPVYDITLDRSEKLVVSADLPLPEAGNLDVFRAYAYVDVSYLPVEGGPPVCCRSLWGMLQLLNDSIVVDAGEGAGSIVTMHANPTIGVHPGATYVFELLAQAGPGSVAVIDPVLTPHPDNPDIVIKLSGAAADPNPTPIMDGITAESLQAMGIDPQPFIDLGFLPASSPPPAPPADSTAPVVVASATPGPNANGWNKGAVTVVLSASDDAGGSGVKEVRYALNGASSGSQVVSGDSASVTVSAEGVTTLTYFAVDNAGNAQGEQTLTVRIDKTAPTLAGLPAAGCSLWPPDHRLVDVGVVTVEDSMSGSAGAPVVTVTSSEPADGTGDSDLGPDALITVGAVQLRAERAGNGTGRIYTIEATASDLAGNTASATATCKVPHDRR